MNAHEVGGMLRYAYIVIYADIVAIREGGGQGRADMRAELDLGSAVCRTHYTFQLSTI